MYIKLTSNEILHENVEKYIWGWQILTLFENII